ncbi:serine acetyltransferase [uncultured Traorella sp.]|uniref:serine acetyltransferase n=1 Tax=uncultured Traorella sp. TaxID=1929048 RepID=UPI0025F9AB69|nr:serine acetyltransferase [uncultured Traorella sp.]
MKNPFSFSSIYRFSRKNRGGVFLLRVIFGCDIPKEAKISDTVEFQHRALGVVVHRDSVIGENCFIQHHVTIGVNKGNTGAPKIGRNVFIGPYAMLLGDITIGDNAVIGAGSIVMKDIEPNAIYTGNSILVKRGYRQLENTEQATSEKKSVR